MPSPATELAESVEQLLGMVELHHEVYDPTPKDIRAIRQAKTRLAHFRGHKIDMRSLPRE